MKKRRIIVLLLVLMMVLVLSACGNGDNGGYGYENGEENGAEEPGEDEAVEDEAAEEDLPVMTLEELAENDGRDGANAYVLVEGIVYDVTDSPRWTDGNHNGNQAGQDLTEEILRDSPHGRSVLDRFEAIARIEE